MNSPAKSRPLRWAEINLDSLSDALAEHAEQAGTSVCLDLRADAYGFGVAVVAPLATQHGFSRAVTAMPSTPRPPGCRLVRKYSAGLVQTDADHLNPLRSPAQA